MPAPDLFADSTMTFGEHLEALRRHLARCVVYLLIACVPATFASEWVLDIITAPIRKALDDFDPDAAEVDPEGPVETAITEGGFWDDVKAWLPGYEDAERFAERDRRARERLAAQKLGDNEIRVTLDRDAVRAALGLPPLMPAPPPPSAAADGGDPADAPPVRVAITLRGEELRQIKKAGRVGRGLVSGNLLEAFSIYLKTILVTAGLMASPLILTELWLFVGAGLYPHERKYVYYFLPVSIGLFAAGALFCFAVVFQFVVPFLLSFNVLTETTPLIQADSWLSFVLLLPGVFGLSFQLPLVMLFFNRIGVVSVQTYWERMNLAILIIAGVSMLLTPTDPGSMIAMMIPLTALYFVGMGMCKYFPTPSSEDPFAGTPAERETLRV